MLQMPPEFGAGSREVFAGRCLPATQGLGYFIEIEPLHKTHNDDFRMLTV
jgi:hypothetical protein